MMTEFTDTKTAIAARGLRVTFVRGVPSPWGEAAKAIFAVKKIDFLAVGLDSTDADQHKWTGSTTAPAAMLDDDPVRTDWRDILEMAERIGSGPQLVPADPEARARMLRLSTDILSAGGLCTARRLQGVHAGLNGLPGFSRGTATYLAERYDYSAEDGIAAGLRVVALLGAFSDRLKAAQGDGPYLMGASLTAVDFYLAAAINMFAPPGDDLCAMHPKSRIAFEAMDDATRAALDPVLLAHRDMMQDRHIALPLWL